jgi:glycosyltransferase involved in cell wall biosynthesis
VTGRSAPEGSSRPLSILWLNQLDPAHPWAGGAERHIDEVGRRLVLDGHRVMLIAERFGDLPAQETRYGIEILRPVRRGLLHAWVFANARRLVEDRSVDVVVGDLSKVVPWGRRRLAGRPLVSVVRHLNGRSMFAEVPFPTGPVLWALERLSPWFLRSADLVTESPATAEVLEHLGVPGAHVTLVPPGVDGDRFRPDPSARSPTPLVVYVGRMKRYKRVDLAIRAFGALRSRVPNAELLLAGGGSDHDRLRLLVTEMGLDGPVRFLGIPRGPELVQLYQRAWVHVQPSSAEGWGLTAMESMACGTPVVAVAGGALAQTVSPTCADLLAAEPSVPALSDALYRALQRPEITDPYAAERLSHTARSFTWAQTATGYEAILRTVAAGRSSARSNPSPVPQPDYSPLSVAASSVSERAVDRSGSG